MKVLMEDVENNRAEWLKLRSETIGSSEIVTVCGLNPWKSPLTLWAEKTGKVEPETENELMRLGTAIEPYIGQRFGREKDMVMQRANALYQHPTIAWATASPDFFAFKKPVDGDFSGVGAPVVVECKNVSFRSMSKWEDGNVPDYAHMQNIWQLGVLGLSAGYIAALLAGDSLVTPEIKYAADLFDQMVEVGEKFMHMLRTDTPPAAIGSDKDLLDTLNKRDPKKEMEFSAEAAPLIAEWTALKSQELAQKSIYEDKKEEVKNVEAKLIQMMGDASIGRYGRVVIKLGRVERKGYFVNPSSYPTISIKEQNGSK